MEQKRFFWDSQLAMWLENRVEDLALWVSEKRYPSAASWEKPFSDSGRSIVTSDPYTYVEPEDTFVATPVKPQKAKKKSPAKKKKAKKA